MTNRKKILLMLTPFPTIAFFGMSPILLSMFAGFITSLFGEQLNEGSPPDVPVIGEVLYSMGVMGWLSLITIPMAAIALLVYLIVFLLNVSKITKEETNPEHTGMS